MYSLFQGSFGSFVPLRNVYPFTSGVTRASRLSGHFPPFVTLYSVSAVSIAVMSTLAFSPWANENRFRTFGTTSVVRSPMMTITTIISARVNPARPPRVRSGMVLMSVSLSRSARSLELPDLEDREHDRNHDIAHDGGQEDDHDRLQD